MKKAFLFSLAVLIPEMCMAEHPEIEKLMKIKQQKLEQLEKCMGTTKGLKIAGISTLGLTVAGVAGNIAEAAVRNDYDKKLDSADKDIEKAHQEYDGKMSDLIAKQVEAQKLKAQQAAEQSVQVQENTTPKNNQEQSVQQQKSAKESGKANSQEKTKRPANQKQQDSKTVVKPAEDNSQDISADETQKEIVQEETVVSETSNDEWQVRIDDNNIKGIVKGVAKCGSYKSGISAGSLGTPDESGDAIYVWCKPESFTPDGGVPKNIDSQWISSGGHQGTSNGCLMEKSWACENAFNSKESFKDRIISTVGALNANVADKNGRHDVESVDVFKDVDVTMDIAKKLVKKYANKKGVYIDADHPDDHYVSFMQDYLTYKKSDPYYSFEFDNIGTPGTNTINKSIAIAICNLAGGHKQTEPDTGLAHAIRCEIELNKCSGLNNEFVSFGYSNIKASLKSKYNTNGSTGAQTLSYNYCRIEY